MIYTQSQIEEASDRFVARQSCDTCPIWERCKRQRYYREVFKEAFLAYGINLRGTPIVKGFSK